MPGGINEKRAIRNVFELSTIKKGWTKKDLYCVCGSATITLVFPD
jgi:hypothetical protein